MELHWTLPHPYGKKVYAYAKIAQEIHYTIQRFVILDAPHLKAGFPLYSSTYHMQGDIVAGLIMVRITVNHPMPAGYQLSEEDVAFIQGFVESSQFLPYTEMAEHLGDAWYNAQTFTYVGPCVDFRVSWEHVQSIVRGWFTNLAVPAAAEMDRTHVPIPPVYDVDNLLKNIYVLESQEEVATTSLKRATCFHLKGIGLVTCNHVLTKHTKIVRNEPPYEKFDVKVVRKNKKFDIAVLNSEGFPLDAGLEVGDSDAVSYTHAVYTYGLPEDSEEGLNVAHPGFVVGFVTVSTVKRIQIGINLVAGMDGSPAINAQGEVVGIVVIGEGRLEKAPYGKHHTLIPINILGLL